MKSKDNLIGDKALYLYGLSEIILVKILEICKNDTVKIKHLDGDYKDETEIVDRNCLYKNHKKIKEAMENFIELSDQIEYYENLRDIEYEIMEKGVI